MGIFKCVPNTGCYGPSITNQNRKYALNTFEWQFLTEHNQGF